MMKRMRRRRCGRVGVARPGERRRKKMWRRNGRDAEDDDATWKGMNPLLLMKDTWKRKKKKARVRKEEEGNSYERD